MAEERRGELLTAFDLAERGLGEHPDDLWLKHRAVLALARAGATEEAARRFEEYGLAGVQDEDVAALHARIFKDLALASEGGESVARSRPRGRPLRRGLCPNGGYYPAMNAATLRPVAGDVAARGNWPTVLGSSPRAARTPITRRPPRPRRSCSVGERPPGSAGAPRPPWRRLRRAGDDAPTAASICEVLDLDQLLERPRRTRRGPLLWSPDRVRGQQGRFPGEAEEAAGGQNRRGGGRHPAGYAYGSLAGGADILWAEALLESGASCTSCSRSRRGVRGYRSLVRARMDRALRSLPGRRTEVRYATDDAFLGDDVLFRYGSELAMGLGASASALSGRRGRQLACGTEAGEWHGGTAIDVATWHRSGRRVTFVSPSGEITSKIPSAPSGAGGTDRRPDSDAGPRGNKRRSSGSGNAVRRCQRFSKLTDEQLPVFACRVLGGSRRFWSATAVRCASQHLGRCGLRRPYRRSHGRSVRA